MDNVGNEIFKICELIKEQSSDNVFYYVMIYSNLTREAERCFLNKSEFEVLSSNPNIDTAKHFIRTYNRYKNKFCIKFIK